MRIKFQSEDLKGKRVLILPQKELLQCRLFTFVLRGLTPLRREYAVPERKLINASQKNFLWFIQRTKEPTHSLFSMGGGLLHVEDYGSYTYHELSAKKELRYAKRNVIIATGRRKIRRNNECNSWRFLFDMNIIFWLVKKLQQFMKPEG